MPEPHSEPPAPRSAEPAPASPRDFSGADLRGVSFRGLTLRHAKFTGARTGIRPRWRLLIAVSAIAVSIALGVVTGLGIRFLKMLIDSGEPRKVALALNAGAALLIYLIAAFWKGGEIATRIVLPVIAALMASVALIAVVTGVGSGIGALAVIAFVLLGVAVVSLGALARAAAGTTAVALFFLAAISGGLAGGVSGGGLPAVLVAVLAVLLGRRALHRSARYPILSRLCVQIACKGGTDFREADLSGADFSGAEVTACDFRGANLGGARFDDATFRLCLFDGDQEVPPSTRPRPRPRAAGPDHSRGVGSGDEGVRHRRLRLPRRAAHRNAAGARR